MKTDDYIYIEPLDEHDEYQHNEIKLTDQILAEYGIQDGASLTIRCGQNRVTVQVKSIRHHQPILYCSHQLLELLRLPAHSHRLRRTFLSDTNTLCIGPIIALLTQINHKRGFNKQQLAPFAEELHQYATSQHCFFYVFSRNGWQDDHVRGFCLTKNKWIEAEMPVPDVVYNRIHSRKYEKSDHIQELFNVFKIGNIPFYNDHFLNKWDVYELLSDNDYLRPYLPETGLMNGLSSLTDMTERFNTVFIKPIHGSLGKDIFRIQKTGDLGWMIDYSSFHGEVDHAFPSLKELYLSLRERLKKQRFIIQQGLDLLAQEKRPLDFRFLCHNKNQGWTVTSAVARVSKQDQFVSNLAKGGEQFKLNTIFEEHFERKEAFQLQKILSELALETANLISQEMVGEYGELGIDLAVDKSGHPWILEVNTKPSKEQDLAGLKIRPSAKAVIGHCYELTYFS